MLHIIINLIIHLNTLLYSINQIKYLIIPTVHISLIKKIN